MSTYLKNILCSVLLLGFIAGPASAQQNKSSGEPGRTIDSLQKLIRSLPAKNDTNRLEPFNQLCRSFNNIGAYDSSIAYGTQLLSISNAIELPTDTSSKIWKAAKRGVSNAYQSIGFANYFKSNYTEALTNWSSQLKINEELNDKTRLAKNLGNVGVVYKELGDLPKALSYYLKDLKMAEEIKNKKIQGQALGNIGVVYWNQGDRPKALEYYYKALTIKEELNDQTEIANTCGNIGIVYMEMAGLKRYDKNNLDTPPYKALYYYKKALTINEAIGNQSGACAVLGNIGNLYSQQNDMNKAKEYYLRALKIAEETGDKSRESIWLTDLGHIYTRATDLSPPPNESLRGFALAEKYLLKALAISSATGARYDHEQAELELSSHYEIRNMPEQALVHYKKAMDEKDSIFNEEKDKEITRKAMTYDFEKKENEKKAEQEKKDEDARAESQKQKLVIGCVGAVLFIVLFFAISILRTLRLTRKQKLIIEEKNKETEEQKNIIEEKNKDILDSIHYAKRIQTSLLPTEKYISKSFTRLRK